LGPEDVEVLAGTSDQAEALQDLVTGFSWIVSLDTGTLDGTITVSDYEVYHELNGLGHVYESGAGLQFVYTGDDLETDSLHFIQVIWFWEEGLGEPTPYLDDEFGVPPFYYSETDDANAHGEGSYAFTDFPSRNPYDGTNAFTWYGAVFLVSEGHTGPYDFLTVHDGIGWGWHAASTEEPGGGGGDSPRPVPEPAAFTVVAVGIAMLARRTFR
jgi:hypothetical protein